MEPHPTLLFADEHMVVLDKPTGWVVHPSGADAPDLLGWLAQQDVPDQLAPVHRLDRGTSGVVLLATSETASHLGRAFSEGLVSKRYFALVFGFTRDKGTIRRPLQDGRRGQKLEAETRYRTLERPARCSLLDVRPATGRKHQIRRHFQGLGHALVGDLRYRPRGRPTVPHFPGRLWLHASDVVLPDGRRWHAPLPDALGQHLSLLGVTGDPCGGELQV